METKLKNTPLDNNFSSLAPEDLLDIGLQADDKNEIIKISQEINQDQLSTVSEFGRIISEHTSRYADELLSHINNEDLNEAGIKLTKVINLARSLNINKLSNNRANINILKFLIMKMSKKYKSVSVGFNNTLQQVENLMLDIGNIQANIAQRNLTLEEIFNAVREEHRLFNLHIVAGKNRLIDLKKQAEQQRNNINNDPICIQNMKDLDNFIEKLNKRVLDLIILRQSSMQNLPTIRIIQANNRSLLDKFNTIREVTIPVWKRQFVLAINLHEQYNAVQLTSTIDNLTNELLRKNSELLYCNAIEAAKSNQRLVIDVDTLSHVQENLIKTVEDVIRIQKESISQRCAAEKQIEVLRDHLRSKLINGA